MLQEIAVDGHDLLADQVGRLTLAQTAVALASLCAGDKVSDVLNGQDPGDDPLEISAAGNMRPASDQRWRLTLTLGPRAGRITHERFKGPDCEIDVAQPQAHRVGI